MKKLGKTYIITLIMLLLSISLKLFSLNKSWVEQCYSVSIYPKIGEILRATFGFVSFSIGDILYGLLFLYLIYVIVKSIYRAINGSWRRATLEKIYGKLNKILQIVLGIYLVFNILWGLNYNRVPVGIALNFSINDTSVADLKKLNLWLLEKVNEEKNLSLADKFTNQDFNFLKKEAKLAFEQLSKNMPVASMGQISVKPTLFNWLGNSAGYTGYYNPFTGEAQVTDNNPQFEIPFVFCHEMAHQLGYAKEMEANFVGFLACAQSRNHLFRYSAYKAMLSYAMADMALVDIRFTKSIYDSLSPEVKKDVRTSRRFRNLQSKLLQPIVMGVYEKFLWSNEQPLGLLSYNEVTGLLIGYYKRQQYRSFY